MLKSYTSYAEQMGELISVSCQEQSITYSCVERSFVFAVVYTSFETLVVLVSKEKATTCIIRICPGLLKQ